MFITSPHDCGECGNYTKKETTLMKLLLLPLYIYTCTVMAQYDLESYCNCLQQLSTS